ncbi:MAG: hypothetical protein IJT41_09985 [Clostridia bacterium]|nr:hypothetical protein [Clostridia bacterium]
MSEGYFDGAMPRKTLEYYLAHAASAQWITMSDTLDDDIRVILKLGLKFLGRAAGIWKASEPDDTHFARVRAAAEKIHAADPEIILQACIFEAVYREDLERTPIPPFVFEAFGLPVENRTFRHEDCTMCPGDNMPDIARLETQMWFYYRGRMYIDCGCEAFHMGQIHLYAAKDRGYTAIGRVIEMLRAYGREHARRHKVIFDAHSHSLVVHGRSLLDYNAMPFTRYPVLDRPGEKLVLVREGKSGGGISPEGVYEKALPFLYEYDNWGGRDNWAHAHQSEQELAWNQWWGGDQISWFAYQDEDARNRFLDYTFKWTAVNNPDGFFAFPLMRGLGESFDGQERVYRLNNRSDACPDGFSQEDAAARLLHAGYGKYRALANPSDMLDFGARDVDDPQTGVRLPEKVVLYGSFQPYVGAVANDSNSEITRMYYVGDGTYALSFVMPYAGEYDFGISTWGTLSACVCEDGGLIYSGSGGKSRFTVPQDNTIVKISFTYMTNAIRIEMLS